MILAAIAAVAENNIIGKQNDLPWHIPEDLKHFKRVTSGHAVIMGRKTYESMGRPLPNRENIVITRNQNFKAEGVKVFSDLNEAISYCKKTRQKEEEVFIIGGGEIYTQALEQIQKLYLTRVHIDAEGDRYFPEINLEKDFEILFEETHEQKEPQVLRYSFIEAKRIKTD